MIRWVYLGRFSVATSIFLAAQLVWSSAATSDTRIASLIFAVTMVFTVASAAYTEVYGTRRGTARLGRNFLYGQCLFDLVLVTAVVHVTGGGASQFALFYILVIASAALLLPVGGGLLVALMGIVCYFVEVLWLSGTSPDIGVWLQLVVFGTVALASGYISARLQEAGQGTAAELVFVRLQADDILRNIRSGIVTVDAQGTLLFANPAAGTLLGIPFADLIGTPVLDRIAHASADRRAGARSGGRRRTPDDAGRGCHPVRGSRISDRTDDDFQRRRRRDRRPDGDRDLPGHLRPEAAGEPACPRGPARGDRRAQRVIGPRDPESAGVDPQRGRAADRHALAGRRDAAARRTAAPVGGSAHAQRPPWQRVRQRLSERPGGTPRVHDAPDEADIEHG